MAVAEPSAHTLVDLIRHGEPVGGRRYRGQTDDPLSDKGWSEMRTAVGELRPWDVIVSSPLTRCFAFARELSARHGLPLETDPRLKEIAFGSWEGRTPEELSVGNPELIHRFREDPVTHRPTGAEPVADFVARVGAAWREIIERHRGRHVLIVGHAGVIRAVMAQTLDVPAHRIYRIFVPTAGITRVRIHHVNGMLSPELLFHAGRL